MKHRYTNPYIRNIRRGITDFIAWLLGVYRSSKNRKSVPSHFSYPNVKGSYDKKFPSLCWVGHCTFLIEVEGVVFLTDPIWNDRCSPFPFLGPKRRHPPGISFDEIPSIDLILISHNHYDHLDEFTVREISRRFPYCKWLVPSGVGQWFLRRGIKNVKEMLWWQQEGIKGLSAGVKITAVPAQHNSGRGLFDMNRSLWVGFVVEVGLKTWYFVGDTAYNKYDFINIGKHFSNIDLSLIPIGTYEPSRFMRTVHSSPSDAARIHRDVGTKKSVAMHWNTFRLSGESMERPPFDLYHELDACNIKHENFHVLHPGQVINW